ncbi:MAG: biotin/lipoyl-binding protein, partial [Thermoanaerobaculia bacterium]
MKKRIIIVVVLVAAIAAVIWAVSLRNRPSDDRIRFSGNIEVDEVQAAFQIPGRLVERAVSEGDRVRKGEVIGRLEDAELTHEVATRRADLDAAQSKLGELEAGFRPEEIADARAALRGAQAELDHQSSELARAKKLYRDDVISQR